MTRRLAALALLAWIAAACVADGTVVVRDEDVGEEREVSLDREFTMKVHDTIVVDGTHLLVFFDGVSEDSRCPSDVQCPWAGNAAVRLELSSQIAEFAPQPRVLNTTLEPQATSFMGVTIRLVDLTPYPNTSNPPIDPASYVVKLIVTRS